MKTYTLPVIGLMTLGASAFAAAAPSTGNSLPARDNFSACKWLGDRFKWFNSERDHKNPYVQEFNVSLRIWMVSSVVLGSLCYGLVQLGWRMGQFLHSRKKSGKL